MRVPVVIAVVLGLILSAVIAYQLTRLADEQSTQNCIAAAEAQYPVVLMNPDQATEDGPQLGNFGERQDAVKACDAPTK